MSKVYLHPTNQGRIDSLIQDLPQSLLIYGPVGVGLTGITTHLLQQIGIVAQTVLPEKDERVDLEKGVISVDSIRRLYDMTKTIETNKRVIIIDYAERMGSQAQNAFLKLLEEPGLNTHFILLTHDTSSLLPTIKSRVQHFEALKLTAEQSETLLDELGVTDATKRTQLLFMAGGLPAELTRLAADERYFEERTQIVRDARNYLQGSNYDRLKLAQAYKDDRLSALLLIKDALAMLQNNIRDGRTELLPKVEQLLAAYERIEANGNVRLHLGAAMV